MFLHSHLLLPISQAILSLNLKVFSIISHSQKVWRLITASICQFNLFSIIIELLIFIPYVIAREKALGTVKYTIYLIVSSVLINLIYSLVMVLISIKYPQALAVPSYGVIPLFFAEITCDCLLHPEEIRSYFFKIISE